MERTNECRNIGTGGSVEGIYAAMLHGADAIYTGTQRFSARAFADNPSVEQLCDILDFAHARDKKIYLTVNTLLTDEELEDHLYDLLLPLYDNGIGCGNCSGYWGNAVYS